LNGRNVRDTQSAESVAYATFRDTGVARPRRRSRMNDRSNGSRARKSKVPDPRVIRTRERLAQALIELYSEGDMGSVNVAGIARRAGVNRATFYRHFEDKLDLVERGTGLLFASLFDEIEAAAPAGSTVRDRIVARVTRFFEIVRDRSNVFHPLISGGAGRVLFKKMSMFVEDLFLEKRLKKVGTGMTLLPLDFTARILTSLLFGFASWWLDHPRSYSARRMAHLYLQSATRGVFTVPNHG
jgi:AcrR family transcriptional regulator